MKDYKDIPKFGLVVGLFSGVFKAVRCVLNNYFPSMHPRLKAFISGVLCSFALQLGTQGEQTVLKLLLYPRVVECCFQFLCEKGLLFKFKHGDILAYALQVFFITYSYLFEPDNLTRGFNKTIDTYCVRQYDDERGCFAKASKMRANLHRKYGPHNSF